MSKHRNSRKREERKVAAQMHIMEMERELAREIADSVATCRHYRPGSMQTCKSAPEHERTAVSIMQADSVSALLELAGPSAVLDFASFHHPGGGFANGASHAQEESLCAESDLYNIQDRLYDRFYKPHKSSQNQGLYTTDALYIDDVVFRRGDAEAVADVIVMAAPNAKAARSNGVSEAEIEAAARERVAAVMNIAAANRVERLIAGAFGCGVFACDPHVVAGAFTDWISDNAGVLREVVFAIPSTRDTTNADAFAEVLSEAGLV